MASSSTDSVTLSRGDIFDLHKLNQEALQTFGLGFLPKPVADVFEKYAILGPDAVNAQRVIAMWQDFLRAKEETLVPKPENAAVLAS